MSDIFAHRRGPSALDPSLKLSTRRLMLSSSYHPADHYSDGDSNCERCCNCFGGMSLQAFGCVVNKLLSSIAALFCGSPGCFHAVLERICNGGCRPRRLARGFGNLLARSFQY